VPAHISKLDHSDREFLAEIHRLGTPTVQQLCDAKGVTATAVRQKLVRLQSGGFVDRQAAPSERGRPHHQYRLTQTGVRELGDNYRELAMLLWKELREIDEPTVRNRVLGRLRESLVRSYGDSVVGTTPQERLRELGAGLKQRGFDVDITSSSSELPILREHSCPYHELASEDSSICDLEQTVFSEIVGAPIQRSQCCLDGHSCCEFQAQVN
jgi:predicted ArsR family transcriptional regulator